jgi:hypothetical protein
VFPRGRMGSGWGSSFIWGSNWRLAITFFSKKVLRR